MSNVTITLAKFDVGCIRMTAGATDTLYPDDVFDAFVRHLDGNWGELDEWDWKLNDCALENGGRLFSSYVDRMGTRIWIITEADRATTTILLPSDY